jgi:hypothetical protein
MTRRDAILEGLSALPRLVEHHDAEGELVGATFTYGRDTFRVGLQELEDLGERVVLEDGGAFDRWILDLTRAGLFALIDPVPAR